MVTLQSNGNRWVARWIDSSGRERFRSIGTKAEMSEREARRVVVALQVEHANNPARRDVARAPKLSQWAKDYAEQRSDLAETTKNLHAAALARLAAFVGDPTIDKITRAQAAGFRGWLETQTFTRGSDDDAERYRYSPATVRRFVASCKQIFEYARLQDVIPYNPFDRQVLGAPPAQESWQYIDEATMVRILAACPSDAWRLGFSIARYAGLRVNEVARAQWAWIDWDRRLLAVARKDDHDTTKSRSRVVPLQERLYATLRASERTGDLICPNLGSDPTKGAERILVAAGISYSKPWHTLRKSLETDWLSKYPIPDVARWLGHSPEIALKFYHQTKADSYALVTGRPTEKPTESLCDRSSADRTAVS